MPDVLSAIIQDYARPVGPPKKHRAMMKWVCFSMHRLQKFVMADVRMLLEDAFSDEPIHPIPPEWVRLFYDALEEGRPFVMGEYIISNVMDEEDDEEEEELVTLLDIRITCCRLSYHGPRAADGPLTDLLTDLLTS